MDRSAPSTIDLLAFFIWHKQNTVPIVEYEYPMQIKKWLIEYHSKSALEWHEFFYDRYEEYVTLFEEELELV